jgi:DNA repair protein RadC
VFDASIGLLKKVGGIGESVAVFIKLISALARVYYEKKYSLVNNICSLGDLCEKLLTKFIGRTEEIVVVMLLDAKGKIVFDGIVSKGTVNAVDLYSRRIVELIVLYSACSMILAHNHPSGLAVPSKDDVETTAQFIKLLRSMRVTLLDHIIVADNDYVSMRDCGFAFLDEGEEDKV